ncbi:NlpC/P60 family protein [Sciscionella marina]|uniref:NlpC/P60 family protein n=1 Tax=Sciscionella marina TaxID=508770 RepID=UPI00058FE30F|nr:NlpC/P60 family protein [Sciscionella marina]
MADRATTRGSALRRTGVLGALTLAAVMTFSGVVAAVPPPPPNPSDNEIDSGRADVNNRAGEVGSITNQLSQAESQLDQLQSQVELKMEQAKKAMVDMESAQQAASKAEQSAQAARGQVDAADAQVRKSRADLDAFAAGSYEQGSTVGSMSAYLGSKNPQEFLERASLLNAVSGAKLNALETMQRARTEKANKESTARAALAEAQRKQATAEQAKSTADSAKQAAITAQQGQQQKTQSITQRKQELEQQLNDAQAKIGGLTDARKKYNEWLAAKQAEQEQAAQQAAAESAASSSGGGGGNSSGGGGGHVSHATGGSASAVIARAKSALGIRYSWGGGNASGPTIGIHDGGVADSYGDYMHSGFDCSGLMTYAFAAAGVSLSSYSGYQYTAGTHVPLSQKQPGDMLFWGRSGIHHVALYIGNGQMIEAPQSGMRVRITSVRYGDIMPYATRVL